MAAVECVMDDHLALSEELGVRTAYARVLDLLVAAPIIDRDNMEGFAHASSHRTARASPVAGGSWFTRRASDPSLHGAGKGRPRRLESRSLV